MSIDERIGQNLAVTRGDMSQKDLAERMRERGWKWSQATVWSIEKGERPLRLAEAEDVAHILQRPMHVLLSQEGEAVVHAATREVHDRYEELLAAMEAYDDARGKLALLLDEIPESTKNGLLRVSTDWIGQTVDAAVEDYRKESVLEFAAMLARYDLTQEQYDATSEGHKWNDRFNKVQQAFRDGGLDGLGSSEA